MGRQGSAPNSARSNQSTLQRAALNRLNNMHASYEFMVTIRKSTYVPLKHSRRRPQEQKSTATIAVDKLNIEVVETGDMLRIDAITEGLVAVWNRSYPFFQVKLGDFFVKVNKAASSAAMLEEL